MKRKTLKGLSGVGALFFAVMCSITSLGYAWEGNVNAALGIQTGNISGTSKDAYVYKSDFTEDGIPSDVGMKKLIEAADTFNKESMEESAVLVCNNGALPLTSETKNITLLGRSVVDPVYKCTGAGASIDENRLVDLEKAMKDAGFNLNQKLLDAYSSSPTARLSGGNSHFIGEENISFYTDEIRKTFSSYGDAAVIMFSRLAGEGVDLAKVDDDGVSQLSLHQQESDLLKMVKDYKDAGVFKKVIVLINSAYAMELDWVNDADYGVDACFWMGNPGLNGFAGIPSLLKGEANPSGCFVDTFATNSLSAPATQNIGDTNFADSGKYYAIYAENIYVGYKYYETRYEDLILDRYGANSSKGVFASSGSWNYADEVAFPFGYGLSYTTFSQTLDSVKWNEDGTIDISVTVQNTGSVAGKSVVQVYAQTPYTDYDIEHNVEKSAVQLLDFAKTDIIEPGKTETVEIKADKYLIASWDSTAHNGKGGYILDSGDYFIAVGDDSHDALNNILAAKGATGLYDEKGNEVEGESAKAKKYTLDKFDDESFRVSEYTEQEVVNRFGSGIYASDYNAYYENGVTYLTRSDWNTFPETVQNLQINDEMLKLKNGDFYDELKEIVGQPEEYTLEVDAELKFIDMKDVEWDDEETWNSFLNQLSVGELSLIISDSWGQKAITKIGKPQNYQGDGPDGVSAKYKYGEKSYNTLYVNEGTMCCSWNKELMSRRGNFIGEDSLYNNTNCAMAPGVDIHRTPYSGRNHEYFSEDGTMSYIMGAVVCKAMQDKGTVAMLKHLAGNDQETNRQNVCNFMREQSLREITLKGFEGCITKGGAMSAMTGYNCIGMVNCARNYALMTEVVRGEWGFKGFFDTDGSDCTDTPALCVVSGIDEFCLSATIDRSIAKLINAGDKYLLDAVMQSNKCFYYTYLRSNLVNGLTTDSKATNTTEWWKIVLIAIDTAFGLVAFATGALYVYTVCVNRDELSFKKGGDDGVEN